MDRINTPTKAVNLFGVGKHGFRDGDLALGVYPTDFDAEFFNGVQEELLAIIEARGIIPSAGTRNQVYQALLLMVGSASGFRNKIINGDFSVNERSFVSGTVLAAGAYAFDKWKAGAAGCTLTFSTVNNVTTVTITAGSLQSVIEGSMLKSGTHVMSWVGTAQGKIGAGAYSASGVTGAAVGGTNLTVEFGIGTLSFVQLEPGSIPSAYDQRPPGVELFLCQRYGHKIKASSLQTRGWAGSPTADIANASYFYPVPLRASPTIPSFPWTLSQASIAGLAVANTNCLIYSVVGTVMSGSAVASNSADFFVSADF